MLLYVSTFFAFFISAFFLKRELALFSVFCLCFFLFFFSGARKLGSSPDDFNYYYSLYYNMNGFEFIYSWIESLNRTFFDANINVQFLFVSFISISVLFLSLLRYKKMAPWSILIYMSHVYLYRDLIQIRAAVAYNILLFSFVFFHNRTAFAKALGSIAVAAGFHISSVFACIAFFLRGRKFTLKKYVCFLIVVLPLTALVELSSLFVKISSYLPTYFGIAINTYILDDGGFAYSKGILNPTTVKTIVFCLLFLYRKKEIDFYIKNELLVNCYVFSSCILIVFNDFAVFSSRMASIFSSVEIFLVPAMVFISSKMEKKVLILFFISVYGVVLFLNLTQKCMLCNYSMDFF